jgi:hypothetical protein
VAQFIEYLSCGGRCLVKLDLDECPRRTVPKWFQPPEFIPGGIDTLKPGPVMCMIFQTPEKLLVAHTAEWDPLQDKLQDMMIVKYREVDPEYAMYLYDVDPNQLPPGLEWFWGEEEAVPRRNGILTIDVATQNVNYNGECFRVPNKRVLELFELIVAADGELVQSAHLRTRVSGCHGRLDVLFRRHLPQSIRDLIRGTKGHRGGYRYLLGTKCADALKTR